MGFSPAGLLIALAVLAPNLLLIWLPPREPLPRVRVPAPLTLLERVGQALCLVVPAITLPGGFAAWWLPPATLALAGYYALWAHYLVTGRVGATLYRSWWILPVPMALLPVLVFLATAAWLMNPWIAIAAGMLAIGHVPASLLIARALALAPEPLSNRPPVAARGAGGRIVATGRPGHAPSVAASKGALEFGSIVQDAGPERWWHGIRRRTSGA